MRKDWERLLNDLGYDTDIQGRSEYFNSVVMVLLLRIEGELYFLLEKRSKQIRQGGEICFPGGKHELGESYLDTALRETEEELGIPRDQIRVVGRLDTVVAPLGAIVESFVGIAETDIADCSVNPREVERLIAIPVSYFMETEPEQYSAVVKVHPTAPDGPNGEQVELLPSARLGLPETYHRPWGNFRYQVYVYPTEDGAIWGITARIIRTFLARLQELGADL